MPNLPPCESIHADARSFDLQQLSARRTPLLLRGFVKYWPVVQAGLQSPRIASDYIKQFYRGETVVAFIGEPAMQGYFFYDETLSGFNFDTVSTKLDFALDQLERQMTTAAARHIYIGSTSIDNYLPGFRVDNDIPSVANNADESSNPLVSIWICNQSRISAHWDAPNNIACSVVGHRRFTLFPPEQLANLYVGPLDKTPGGQAISLVDFHNPDFERFPRYGEALAQALVADMEPGDAIYMPSMWWHQVESLDGLNVLVNYWFRNLPAYCGLPIDAMHHALLAIKDLPPAQKKIWRDLFDYYVFSNDESRFSHIPDAAKTYLGPMTEDNARKLRARLLAKLNR